MKRLLFLLVLLSIGLTLKSECPSSADDVTFVDCQGNDFQLFDLLDGGQYVLIHFVSDLNSGGQTNRMIDLYHNYGCNGRDVFFMEILPNSDDEVCLMWMDSLLIEFPVVGAAFGDLIVQYADCMHYTGNNRFLLILPDHSVFQESLCYNITQVFDSYGIQPQDCNFGSCVAPENLTADLSDGGLDLTWTAVEGAEYYHVFARNAPNVPFYLVGNVEEPYIEDVSYCPTVENCYYVTSCCADGSENASEMVCIGPQAVDFTLTDVHGDVINLYEILDRGQFVFIDFFNYTCISCREVAPYIVESYYRYGCNEGDVFYLEVSALDPDTLCQKWIEEFGVEYPTVSREGGGRKFADAYCLTASPHYFLVAPNRDIVLDGGISGFYIYDLQSVIDAFESLGIEEQQCEVATEDYQNSHVEIYPNPADGFVNIGASGVIHVYNAMGQLMDVFIANNQQFRINTSKYTDGLYFIQVDGRQFGKFVVRH